MDLRSILNPMRPRKAGEAAASSPAALAASAPSSLRPQSTSSSLPTPSSESATAFKSYSSAHAAAANTPSPNSLPILPPLSRSSSAITSPFQLRRLAFALPSLSTPRYEEESSPDSVASPRTPPDYFAPHFDDRRVLSAPAAAKVSGSHRHTASASSRIPSLPSKRYKSARPSVVHRTSSSLSSIATPMDYGMYIDDSFMQSYGTSSMQTQTYQSILPSPQMLNYAQQQPTMQQSHSIHMCPPIPQTPIERYEQPEEPVLDQTSDDLQRGTKRKNHYPCPCAKQYNCTDHFTTSGHAARHSKKHTGKKDAICPECDKAFTRKDNMEQHRRIHKDGIVKAEDAVDVKVNRKVLKQKHQTKQRTRKNDSVSIVPPSLVTESTVSSTVSAPLSSSGHGSSSAQDNTIVASMAYEPPMQTPSTLPSYDSLSPPTHWPTPSGGHLSYSSYMPQTSSTSMQHARPSLHRSSYEDAFHGSNSIASPSGSSAAGSMDSNGLDMLANAADQAR